jgi:hypothetical protein
MTFNEIIKSLKKANVSSPGKALQLLPKFLKASATDERDTLDILQARLNRHSNAEIEGRVSRKELNVEYQELVTAVKDFINGLSKEIIATGADLLDKHFEHILLVCSEQRVDYIKKQLFPSDYFPNAKWNGDITGATDHFEIIFFDAKSFENNDVLEDYLKNHSAYLLWFGTGRNSLLDNYQERAYFCNSPFSVYARLQEMLSFIKYFNGQTLF